MIILLLLVRATYMWVLFFTHIPFVVNHKISATPTEKMQHLQGMYINLTWNCRVCVEAAILCLLCACLPSLTTCRELTNNTLRKQRWSIFLYRQHFFTFNFECHNRYSKLLLCNYENGDIAWCNKNNTECGFCVFSKKNKNLFHFK